MTTHPPATSKWLPDRSGYELPDKTIVRIWNGHMLYLSRASEQQKAQAEIVKERREATQD